jgi:hypothetical protein
MAYYSDSAKARILAIDPQAANWINSRPRRPAAPTAATRPSATTARPNQFGGPCQRCHGHVAAGQGVLGEKTGGRFTVFHADGTCPDKQHTPSAPGQPKTAARPARPNKYAGACITCGAQVPAETGLAIKTDAGWKTSHHDGQCPPPQQTPHSAPARHDGPANLYGGRCIECDEWVEAEHGVRVKTQAGWKVAHRGQCPIDAEEEAGGRIELTAEQIAQLPVPGYATVVLTGDIYAVRDGLDDVDYRTFRIRIRDDKGRRNPGLVEIAYLMGANNDHDYMPLGVIKDGALVCRIAIRDDGMRTALDILLADPKAAQAGYAIANESCARCGRHLSVPASIERYLGPECAKKGL